MKNNLVVVTGGGSGIGAATAKLFAKNQAKVLVADINIENAEVVTMSIKAADGYASSYKLDVTKPNQVELFVKEITAKYGGIDVMVCNAGIGNSTLTKTAEHSLEDWNNVIAVNQNGVFYCMKYALQQMAKQKKGCIVNVSSLAGLKASKNHIAYTASKFAVVGMTKSAALEYASKNIRINCVCPGYTHSALLESLFSMKDQLREKLLQFIPMKRYGQPEEIAEAIYWLASEKTNFITGQALTIDGGISL